MNGNRHIRGILRGFDQFMNLVLEDTVEVQQQDKINIGMVVHTIHTDKTYDTYILCAIRHYMCLLVCVCFCMYVCVCMCWLYAGGSR